MVITPMEREMLTNALIPTNGVFITKSFSPSGYVVARYDAVGFASSPRWFATLNAAQSYAAKLSSPLTA